MKNLSDLLHRSDTKTYSNNEFSFCDLKGHRSIIGHLLYLFTSSQYNQLDWYYIARNHNW